MTSLRLLVCAGLLGGAAFAQSAIAAPIFSDNFDNDAAGVITAIVPVMCHPFPFLWHR